MRFSLRSSMGVVISRVAILLFMCGMLIAASSGNSSPARAAGAAHMSVNCASSASCSEVQNPEEVFGQDNYVGHDEPSVLFYSNRPDSGNQMSYGFKLPTTPKPPSRG